MFAVNPRQLLVVGHFDHYRNARSIDFGPRFGLIVARSDHDDSRTAGMNWKPLLADRV
jgi:hypothetical protein